MKNIQTLKWKQKLHKLKLIQIFKKKKTITVNNLLTWCNTITKTEIKSNKLYRRIKKTNIKIYKSIIISIILK